MRKPARIIPWSSTMRTRTDEGGSIAIYSLQLERNVYHNDGLDGRRPGHLGGAPEGRGPLGDRPRGEGLGFPWGMATLALGRFLQDQLGHKRGLGGRPYLPKAFPWLRQPLHS